MKTLLSKLGVSYHDGSINFIALTFYAVAGRLVYNPSIDANIAVLIVGMIYAYDSYFINKQPENFVSEEDRALDLSSIQSDINKLKLAAGIKEFKTEAVQKRRGQQ